MCGDAKTRSLGMAGALRKIWAEDGVKGFFRGNGANMVCATPTREHIIICFACVTRT